MPSDHLAVSLKCHPAHPGVVSEIAREVELEMVEDPFAKLMLASDMSEPMAQRAAQWSLQGVAKGRWMSANTVRVEAAVEEYLHDEESEPAAIFLDTAAAFPSVEWAYMR